ncbi:titin homolog [Drosophila miranda]|uniref:titin homolog n=1 Tax=Drosophila miranda TaxID=7229 RepID=UPI0007E6EC0B|nr:titin homolog [Drosophila miranda]
MIHRNKTPRYLAEGDTKDKDDQVYCVVLHVVEAINFNGRDGERETIVMNAALNTVDFEVEGTPSATAETIIFNSNCIWECDMAAIKRIKTDHRPVKLTFFTCSKHLQRKAIGTVLLPVRGLPVIASSSNSNSLHLKMFWHKLICINTQFRSHKPEVLLLLAIIKKSILHNEDFEHLMQVSHSKEIGNPTGPLQSPGHSITASMLQSQANVYVQSLVQLGLLQVGNDPLIDCDIFEVVLQFKTLKNLAKLVKSLSHGKQTTKSVTLVFDFVGNVTSIDLKPNDSEAYILNDVLGLRFKSSLRSIRLYFQRIFYLPINMYLNGTAIANYRMDFGKLLPADSYFSDNRKFVRNGCFTFNRFGRMDSSRDLKPQMEYAFTVELKAIYSRPTSDVEELKHDRPPDPSALTKERKSEPKDQKYENASPNVGAEATDAPSNTIMPSTDGQNSGEPAYTSKDLRRRKKFTQTEFEQDIEEVCVVRRHSSTVLRKSIEPNDKSMKKISSSPTFQYSNDSNATECLATYGNQKFNNDISKDQNSEGPKEELIEEGKERAKASKNVERKESERADQSLVPPKIPKIKAEATDIKPGKESEQAPSMEQLTKLLGQEVEKLSKSVEIFENRSQQNLRKSRKMDKASAEDPYLSETDSTSCFDSIDQPDLRVRRKHLKKASRTKLPSSKQRSALSINQSHSKETNDRRVSSGQKRFVQESIDETAASIESVWSEDSATSRESPQKTFRIKVKHSDLDISSASVCEVQPSEEPESNQKKAPAKPRAPTKGKMSTTELSLRARWVEVNKIQAQALDETEKFLEQTCQAELRKVLQEDQAALGQPKLVESKKKLRKARSSKARVHRDPDSDNVEVKEHVDNAKKNKSVLPVESSEHSLSIVSSESSLQVIRSQASEQRIKRLIKKMKASKTTIQEEKINHETSNEVPDKPLKKKSRKKISVVVVEPSEQREDPVQAQPKKKVVKKRSKPVINQKSDDLLAAEKTSSKKCLREDSTLKLPERTSYMSAVECLSPKDVGEKLKAWRQHQIRLFEEELADKEQQYKNELQKMEYQELSRVYTTLDETLASNQASKDTSIDYEAKFNDLDQQLSTVKREVGEQVQLFDKRSQEMQQENKQLAIEKTKLKERIFQMEMQIHQLHDQGKGPDDRDLTHILKELRSQNDRYVELSKEKDRYKKQWRRSVKQVQDLKLAMYEKNVEKEVELIDECSFNLKNVLTKNMQEFEQEYGYLRHTNGPPSFQVSSISGSREYASDNSIDL